MGLIKTAVRVKEEEKCPTRVYSNKQEKDVSKKLNGRNTINSGATPFDKGDVLTEKFLLECKTQTKIKNSFTLKKEWFDKNEKESLFMGKPYSAVVFNFGPDEKNYYIIDENTFMNFLEFLEK